MGRSEQNQSSMDERMTKKRKLSQGSQRKVSVSLRPNEMAPDSEEELGEEAEDVEFEMRVSSQSGRRSSIGGGSNFSGGDDLLSRPSKHVQKTAPSSMNSDTFKVYAPFISMSSSRTMENWKKEKLIGRCDFDMLWYLLEHHIYTPLLKKANKYELRGELNSRVVLSTLFDVILDLAMEVDDELKFGEEDDDPPVVVVKSPEADVDFERPWSQDSCIDLQAVHEHKSGADWVFLSRLKKSIDTLVAVLGTDMKDARLISEWHSKHKYQLGAYSQTLGLSNAESDRLNPLFLLGISLGYWAVMQLESFGVLEVDRSGNFTQKSMATYESIRRGGPSKNELEMTLESTKRILRSEYNCKILPKKYLVGHIHVQDTVDTWQDIRSRIDTPSLSTIALLEFLMKVCLGRRVTTWNTNIVKALLERSQKRVQLEVGKHFIENRKEMMRARYNEEEHPLFEYIDPLDAIIKRAAALIVHRGPIVVLTGARLTGCPDFGSLWVEYDPNCFTERPEQYWELARKMFEFVSREHLNPTHMALAELEKNGLVSLIITQNVDNLHQFAGNKKVYELHGNASTSTCTSCKENFAMDKLMQTHEVPTCPACGGMIKMDVGLSSSEPLPQAISQVLAEKRVLLVVGASLEVSPVVDEFKKNKGKVLVCDSDESLGDVVIGAPAAEILPRLVQACTVLLK